MSTTYTTNASLGYPGHGDRDYDLIVNQTIEDLESVNAINGCAVTIPAAERPTSATLNVQVAPGSFRKSDGTVVDYAGAATQALTASSTNYIYLTDAGVLTVSTSAFPAGNIVRLAVVTTDTSTVTDIADARVSLLSAGAAGGAYLALTGGTMDDSGGVVTVNVGTANGTKIGGGATQKLGFWGATPIVQPSGGAQAALTDSTTGTPGTTVNDVGASFTQATLNDNFASILNLLNAIRTALVNAGIMKGSA